MMILELIPTIELRESILQADLIVSSAASNLNMRSGSASYSLVKQGGAQLQTDCNRLYPNGIEDGEVAVIDSGNLNCDRVYLTSLPSWKEAASNGGKVSRSKVRNCFWLNCLPVNDTDFIRLLINVLFSYRKSLLRLTDLTTRTWCHRVIIDV